MERGALRNLQGGGVSRSLPDVRKLGLRLIQGTSWTNSISHNQQVLATHFPDENTEVRDELICLEL